MKLKIALIALLSVSAICALSLEGFKCRVHTVMTGDLVRPVRMVRICGVEDYAEPSSYLDLKNIAEIADEQQARKNYATNSNGNTAYWPNRDASHSPPPAYARWPLLPQTANNDGVQLYSTIYRGLAVQPATYEAAATYPANSRDRMAAEHLLQEKLRSLTEDTSEMKNSMNDVAAHMKTILATSLMQNANQPQDINVNVNFKLDPAFEALLKDFMALLKSEVNSDAESAESSATERIEDNSADYDSLLSIVSANENSAEEQVTEAAVDSAEHTTEPDSIEGYDLNNSDEDFDSWLRLHFGPIVKTPTYDEDTDNSEPENSAEKSEESFESWFNAVYRKHTTEAPTDEQTQNSQESQEVNVQKGSVENSQESDNQYEYIDADMNPEFYVTIAKSSEENTVSEETTESSEEALFVPTTMNSLQSSETVELFETGDRYNYATGMYEKMTMDQILECMDSAYRTSSNDLEFLRKNLLKCQTADQISHEIEESKESEETDAAVTDSNESKSSEETETPINDSNESKSSEETETPINDSNESKSSAETEAAITESNESKSSEETETPINDSNESKSSEETETPINDSNESKSSAETEAAITESNESKSSEETETPITESEDSSEIESYIDYANSRLIDWNNYDDEYSHRLIID